VNRQIVKRETANVKMSPITISLCISSYFLLLTVNRQSSIVKRQTWNGKREYLSDYQFPLYLIVHLTSYFWSWNGNRESSIVNISPITISRCISSYFLLLTSYFWSWNGKR